jgi:type VII secretion integral membrane protein EccD
VAYAFTRITVAGPAARADVSIPGDVSVAEVLRLMGSPASEEPRQWILQHPVKGPLAPDSSLSAAGILDGETLYLRPAEDGPLAPFAEDVAEETAALADASAGTWTPEALRTAAAVLLAVWLGLFGPMLLWRFGATAEIAQVLVPTTAGVAVGAIAARRLGRNAIAAGLAFALVALSASTAVAAGGAAHFPPALITCYGALAAAVAAAAALWLGPAFSAVAMAAGTASLLVTAWGAVSALGLPPNRGAAAGGLLGVVAIGFLPRLAIDGVGLGRLADEVSEGEAVHRSKVREVAQRARTSLVWLLIGVAVPSAAGLVVLAWDSGAWSQACAAALAAALWLRARAYSHVSHVLVLTCAGVAGLIAAAEALVRRADQPAVPLVIFVAVTTVLGICSMVRPREITRIRLRTLLDRVDVVLMVACGPLLLGVFNAYGWAAQLGGR